VYSLIHVKAYPLPRVLVWSCRGDEPLWKKPQGRASSWGAWRQGGDGSSAAMSRRD